MAPGLHAKTGFSLTAEMEVRKDSFQRKDAKAQRAQSLLMFVINCNSQDLVSTRQCHINPNSDYDFLPVQPGLAI